MISIARKNLNLSSLFSNPNLSLRTSNAHFFPSIIHLFSTSRIKRTFIIPSPEIYDVLVNKDQFSPDLASLASSRLPQFRSAERADSVLSFLKENSFTNAQLQKMVVSYPRILGFTVEGLKFKFKVFQDLGLSPEDIAKMMHNGTTILQLSMSNKIVPDLSVLKGLLGSNEEVARLLRRSPWFVLSDLEKTLMPNLEILRSCGIPMDLVVRCLCTKCRFMLIKPDLMRKSVDKAIEFGFSPTSSKFVDAAIVFGYTSEGMWEVKLQTLRDLGFSDDEIFAMFRKRPMAFSVSAKRMKEFIEPALATGKFNISNIVSWPASLTCSIEKRLKPRLHILEVLESRNLIEKWPAFSTLLQFTEDKFVDRFIRPYYEVIGEEHIPKTYLRKRTYLFILCFSIVANSSAKYVEHRRPILDVFGHGGRKELRRALIHPRCPNTCPGSAGRATTCVQAKDR